MAGGGAQEAAETAPTGFKFDVSGCGRAESSTLPRRGYAFFFFFRSSRSRSHAKITGVTIKI